MINFIKLALKATGKYKTLNYMYFNAYNKVCVNYTTLSSIHTSNMLLKHPIIYIQSTL